MPFSWRIKYIKYLPWAIFWTPSWFPFPYSSNLYSAKEYVWQTSLCVPMTHRTAPPSVSGTDRRTSTTFYTKAKIVKIQQIPLKVNSLRHFESFANSAVHIALGQHEYGRVESVLTGCSLLLQVVIVEVCVWSLGENRPHALVRLNLVLKIKEPLDNKFQIRMRILTKLKN